MLPPGHSAIGYLVGFSVAKICFPELPLEQQYLLLGVGIVAGNLPDLDFFYSFAKNKSFTNPNGKINHRQFITHTPIFWIIVSLLLWVSLPTELGKAITTVIFFGTISHLVLDSLQYGIKWLWPISKKLYAVRDTNIDKAATTEKTFWKSWTEFVFKYFKHFHFSLSFEALIVITALITIYFQFIH